jgi:hypothetical protein
MYFCGSLCSLHRNKASPVQSKQSNSRLPSVRPPRDLWYITNGIMAMGPTPFDNVARSVAEGRVGRSAFIRHASWKVWQRYEDIEALDTLALWHLVDRLGRASSDVHSRIQPPASDEPPPRTNEELASAVYSQRIARSSIRPVAVDPVGVLGQAQNIEEALLLTLSTAVAAASAHVGAIHRYHDDLQSAVTACAQGSGVEQLLGLQLPNSDPTVLAALMGSTVLGEPVLGDAGRHISARFALAGLAPVGVAMVPIRLFDSLVALVEIGQMWRTFTAKEVSRVEDVADVLAERLVVNGWFEVPG